tara:strand:- start:84 stop:1289 length:1206 start_codon:yes stop_codon:yes gene_type:complete
MNSIQYLLNIESKGIKLGLERTRDLMNKCGNPHLGLQSIQVAGTNGKGSVCAMIANILKSAGYKIGLFTSPHLISINERIRINGCPILNSEIDEFITNNKLHIENTNSTFFEAMTALGFWYFKKHNVDFAIMETGLGGRLDSVSICEPIATVLTPISLDHVEILGPTIADIAFEKAGIIKKNIPCIISQQNEEALEVIKIKCEQMNAPIHFVDNKNKMKNIFINIPGKVQKENANLAIETITKIKGINISKSDIINGLKTVKWYGRNQHIQKKPLIIFDVGHNANGIKSFLEYFKSLKIKGQTTIIIALQARKNISCISHHIQKNFNTIICTEVGGKNPMPAKKLATYFSNKKNLKIITNIEFAIQNSLKSLCSNDALAIIGSHYIGSAINNIFNISFEKY